MRDQEEDSGGAGRVLVVDDDATTLEAITDALVPEGYVVRSAPNGAVGLERVLTFRPEVVVFDFWMPVADGRELVQGIREVARARVGLVCISGTPEVEDWCGRVGVSAFVRKPFEAGVLRAAVAKALGESRRSSSMALAAALADSTRESDSPTSRRRRTERAVLIVGEGETAQALRRTLRESPTPMQVAIVSAVSDATLALASISVDAIAVCGEVAMADPAITELVATSISRKLPIVLQALPSTGVSSDPLVRISLAPDVGPVARSVEEALLSCVS